RPTCRGRTKCPSSWSDATRLILPVGLVEPLPLACPPAPPDTRLAGAAHLPSTSSSSLLRPSPVAPNGPATTPAAIRTGRHAEELRRVASCLPRAVGASSKASPAPCPASPCPLDPRRSACHAACSSRAATNLAGAVCPLARSNRRQ